MGYIKVYFLILITTEYFVEPFSFTLCAKRSVEVHFYFLPFVSLQKVPSHCLRIKGKMCQAHTLGTVEPCTLAQSEHLWDLAVTKPMILSTKGINMTWCGYIGLQHIQKSAF